MNDADIDNSRSAVRSSSHTDSSSNISSSNTDSSSNVDSSTNTDRSSNIGSSSSIDSSSVIDNKRARNGSPTGRVVSDCGSDSSCVRQTGLSSNGLNCSKDSCSLSTIRAVSGSSSHASADSSGSSCNRSSGSCCVSRRACRSSDTRRRHRSSICRSNNNNNNCSGTGVALAKADAGEDAACTFYLVTNEQQKDLPAKGRRRALKRQSSSQAGRRHRTSTATTAAPATWLCSVAGCGARFRKKAHAQRHAAVHTAERPYSCACCSASFKRSEHLRRHCFIVHQNAQAFLDGSSSSSATGACSAKGEKTSAGDGGDGCGGAAGQRSAAGEGDLGDAICFISGSSGGRNDVRENAAVGTRKEPARGENTEEAGVGPRGNASGRPARRDVCFSSKIESLKHASESFSQRRRSTAAKRKKMDPQEEEDTAGGAAAGTIASADREVSGAGGSISTLASSVADAVVAVSPISVSVSGDLPVAAASNLCDFSAAAVVGTLRGRRGAFGAAAVAPATDGGAASAEAIAAATFASARVAADAFTGQQEREHVRQEAASAGNPVAASGPGESDAQASSTPRAAAAAAGLSSAAVRRPFACEKCGRTFVLKQHLTRHAKCHVGRYACKECDAAFAKKLQLRLHLLEHLVSRVEEEKNGIERAANTRADKGRGGSEGNEGAASQGMALSGRLPEEDEETQELTTTCPKAERTSKDPACEKKGFLCPHQGCGAVFCSLDRLYIHLKRVSTRARDYKCETCSQIFLRFSALVAHRRAAHPSNVYVCTLCSKRFSRVTRLREHIRARHDENGNDSDEDAQRATADDASSLCPVPSCGLAFATVSNMRAHYRVKHMQLREFKCGKCGAAFGFKAVLRRHVARVHGGNLESSATPPSEAYADVAAGTQPTALESSAVVTSKSEGTTRSDYVTEESDFCSSSKIETYASRTDTGASSVRTVDYKLLNVNGRPTEERLAARENLTQSKDTCCSGFFVDTTVLQREEGELRQGRPLPHQAEAEHRNVTLSSAVPTGGTRGQPSAGTEEDSPAGQTDKEDSRLPTLYRSLTYSEWIVDAVRLNLLPVTVEGPL